MAIEASNPPSVPRPDLSGFFIWAFCGYVLLIVLSAPLLAFLTHTRGAGAEITFDRLRFAVVNAATLTGFQTSLPPATYRDPGKILILALTLLGTLFTLIVGGLAAARILRSAVTDRQIVSFACAATALFVIVGALPFMFDHSIIESLMLGASAFGNSGVTVGPAPGIYDWRTHMVLLPVAVLGALGLPVIHNLWDVIRLRSSLSPHSRTVLSVTAGLYLAALILFVLAQISDGSPPPWRRVFASSSIAAVNTRTFGLHVEFANLWPRAMQWLAIPLMLIGGATAGTAGGFKLTTAALIVRGVRQSIAGVNPGRLFGLAITLVAAYGALLLLFLCILLSTQPQVPAERLFFETASAISNTGLSIDAITTVSGGLDITSLAMLAGRLLPLAFLCHLACKDHPADLAIA